MTKRKPKVMEAWAAVALVERRLTYTRFLEVVSKLQKVKP